MRETIFVAIGAAGGAIASALGGCDYFLQALLVLMVVDYVSGLVVAGIFKKSKKTKSGALNSHIGFKGIIKKGMMLLMVLIAYRLDYVIGWDFVRYGMIIALLVNELISIVENAGLMGIPVSAVFKKAIDILGKKGEENIKKEFVEKSIDENDTKKNEDKNQKAGTTNNKSQKDQIVKEC